MSGIHVRTVKMVDPQDPSGDCAVQIQIWPLPQDDALLAELNAVVRTAAHKLMVERGMAAPGWDDLTAKGPGH